MDEVSGETEQLGSALAVGQNDRQTGLKTKNRQFRFQTHFEQLDSNLLSTLFRLSFKFRVISSGNLVSQAYMVQVHHHIRPQPIHAFWNGPADLKLD
jgi:hypothetical protein